MVGARSVATRCEQPLGASTRSDGRVHDCARAYTARLAPERSRRLAPELSRPGCGAIRTYQSADASSLAEVSSRARPTQESIGIETPA